MTLILQAPYPTIQTTSLLPSPQFSDSEAPQQAINIRRAMDGTRRTYIKSNELSKLVYTFALWRGKALELRAFIESYYFATIKLTNHKGEIWLVNFSTNPFESTDQELTQVTLEMQGTLLSGPSAPAC